MKKPVLFNTGMVCPGTHFSIATSYFTGGYDLHWRAEDDLKDYFLNSGSQRTEKLPQAQEFVRNIKLIWL